MLSLSFFVACQIARTNNYRNIFLHEYELAKMHIEITGSELYLKIFILSVHGRQRDVILAGLTESQWPNLHTLQIVQ